MTNPIPSSDLDTLVGDIERLSVETHGSPQAMGTWLLEKREEICTAITSLRNQLTASEARERELREALEEVTDLAGSLLWKAEDDPCIKRAHRLTNTENHHDR